MGELIATTERLLITRFTTADASFFLQLVNSDGWLKYIGDRGVHSIPDAEEYLLNGAIKSYAENGFGGYCLTLRDEDVKIGSCGLYHRRGLEFPDLGFALLPEHEGKGYAFEASQAILDLAVSEQKLSVISAITAKNNDRSVRLLEKLGFRKSGVVTLPNDTEELNLFDLNLSVR